METTEITRVSSMVEMKLNVSGQAITRLGLRVGFCRPLHRGAALRAFVLSLYNHSDCQLLLCR